MLALPPAFGDPSRSGAQAPTDGGVIPTAADALESQRALGQRLATWEGPLSVSCSATHLATLLTIYGVNSGDHQDWIVRILREMAPAHRSKPVGVRFARAEVRSEETTDDGGTLRVRGPEERLREARVE